MVVAREDGALPVRLREDLYEAIGSSYLAGLGLTRRQFLQLTAAGTIALVLSGCQTIEQILDKIAKRPVRRDINSLAAGDPALATFQQAVQAMKNLPSSDARNWVRQQNIHRDFCPHGNWLFLPWHRGYIYRFEEICRQLTGNNDFALPYWNWSKDRSVPAVFFDTTSPLFDPTRNQDGTRQISTSITGPPEIESILDEPNFLLFGSGQIGASVSQKTSAGYGPLESGPHNSVHGFVQGNMGFVSLSPLDPVFWTHHNMIECIWFEWIMKRGNPTTNDSAWTGRTFTEFYDRNGGPVSFTVFDMILYPLFLYRYDDPVLGEP